MKGLTGIVVGIGILVVVGIGLIVGCLSIYNAEITLRTQVEAKSQERDIVFDNTWKIIQQQAQVSEKYTETFKEIYPLLMSERYKEGEAQLAKLVLEANPTLDTRLFEKLMNSIEVQRTIFARTQKELIDINREHTLLISKFPASIFFSLIGRDSIIITLVTSERTKQIIQAGEENNLEVF